jgi:8-oxo-dGTP pyrophosphatase MutT (NUDIX family)
VRRWRDPDLGHWDALVVGSDPVVAPPTDVDPPPTVGGLPPSLFREGDRVTVDGSAGVVELWDVPALPVVTAFVQRGDGRVLLLRRSRRVGSFRGRWAAVSGHLEGRGPEVQARRELEEETGLRARDLTLQAAGARLLVREPDRIYVVYPFRFSVRRPRIRLDWEHTASEWIPPSHIGNRRSVPGLRAAWERVRAGGPPAARKR